MPKYRGRVDCYINPSIPDSLIGNGTNEGLASRATGEIFTNIVQHISSSGADLGIEMISANYGISGSGLDFWDTANPAGARGWACFRFHSASLGKFDCFIFQMTGSVNTTPFGDPIAVQGKTTITNRTHAGTFLGVSFAAHPSGSNVTQSDGPWNGDYNLTSGTVGNPIWKVNSSGKGAFFPRENGILGSFSGSRGYLSSILTTNYNFDSFFPLRLHVVASEDSLTIISDLSNNGNHKFLHFGSYTPRAGLTPPPDSPYFMFTNGQDNESPIPNFYGTAVGSLTGPTNATDVFSDGAMAHPDLTSGSKSFSFTSLNINQTNGYNFYVNSGSFEMANFFPVINEAPNFFGTLGIANHIRFAVGPVNRSVSENSSSAVFGRDTLSEVKFITPWGGDAPNTTALVRTGRNFSIG